MLDITKLKLNELSIIKSERTKKYLQIESESSQIKCKREKLVFMFKELGKLANDSDWKCQEITNLDKIITFDDTINLSDEKVLYWSDLLYKEIEYGKKSINYAYLYSKILIEWDKDLKSKNNKDKLNKEFLTYLEKLWGNKPDKIDTTIIDNIILDSSTVFEYIKESTRNLSFNILKKKVDKSELKSCIEKICNNIYRKKSVKVYGKNLLTNEILQIEYCGAISILLRNIDKWNYSAAPLYINTIWTKNKWRPYLDEDFFTVYSLKY